MKRRLDAAVLRTFGDLSRLERDHLSAAALRGFSGTDTAAAVLGVNLWRDEIATWRERFASAEERPSMWRFEFGSSAAWDVRAWRSLPLEARVFRARVGSLAHDVGRDGLVRAGVDIATRTRCLQALRGAGLARGFDDDVRFFRIASPKELTVDLALVVIVAHWLRACAVADAIANDRSTSDVEVHGYAGACGYCRKVWGVRRKERWTLPPLHPACRCFAQPAYRNAARNVRQGT